MEEEIAIFISYAHADKDLRQALEQHLAALSEVRNISIWHDEKVIAGQNTEQAIEAHFNTAKIILLLISSDFIASDRCSREVRRAIERHKREETHVLPIILRPVDWHGSLFGNLQALPEGEEAITSWHNVDAAFVNVVKGVRKALPAPKRPATFLWNVPPRNPYFTGREIHLKQLHNALSGKQKDRNTHIQALSGLGGGGKTQIALEYVYRYSTQYKHIFWARAESRDALLADYMGIGRALKIESILRAKIENGDAPLTSGTNMAESKRKEQTQIINIMKGWFQDNTDWLLILDNVDEFATMYEFMPTLGQGSALITSRMTPLGNRVPHPVEVDIMNSEEGILFLLRRADILSSEETLDTISEKTRIAASELVEELGSLPLALDQAGAYIKKTSCSLPQYINLYKKHTIKMLKRREPSTEYPQSIATTWSLAFQKVGKASPIATEILRLCAFLYSDIIPEDIFTEGKNDLGPILSKVEDDLALNDALGVLLQYSLVKRNAEARTLTIHRLVQTVLRDDLSKRQQLKWAERAICVINRMFPTVRRMPVDTTQWPICEQYLLHAQVCLTLSEQYSLQLPEAAHLFNHAGCYLYVRGQYTEAQPFCKRALEICEHILGEERSEVAASLDLLAAVYHKQGKYSEEEPLFQCIISYQEKTLGPEHPDLIKSLHGLGKCYYRQGKYAEAEPILQRARSIVGNALRPENANVLSMLGILYWEQGKYAEAEPLYLQVLSIFENALGPEHPDVAHSLTRLGLLYTAQGQFTEAMSLHQRALSILEATLGPEHPNVAISLSNIGGLYYERGKYTEAEPLWRRALAIFEKALGPEHDHVGTSLNNLGDLYVHQEKYTEAERLLQRALSIHKKFLGLDYIRTVNDINSLGTLYTRQRKYAEAETYLQQALTLYEKNLGPEHPNVADSLISLGMLYHQQDKDDEARLLLQRALTIQEKMLGPKHPKTLATQEQYKSLLDQMK